jgi:membrane-associated phospholipid phosphatase
MWHARLIVFFVVLYHSPVFSQNADIDLLRKIYLNRNEKLDPGFRFISRTVTPVVIISPVSQMGYGWIKPVQTVLRTGYTNAASALLGGALSTSVKYIVNRERPYVTYPDIVKGGNAGLASFPSGHTVYAFATATSLSLAYPKWYVIAPSYGWAAAVGYSRMHLGMHYPSDVLAGAIIGSGAAFLCYRVAQRIP